MAFFLLSKFCEPHQENLTNHNSRSIALWISPVVVFFNKVSNHRYIRKVHFQSKNFRSDEFKISSLFYWSCQHFSHWRKIPFMLLHYYIRLQRDSNQSLNDPSLLYSHPASNNFHRKWKSHLHFSSLPIELNYILRVVTPDSISCLLSPWQKGTSSRRPKWNPHRSADLLRFGNDPPSRRRLPNYHTSPDSSLPISNHLDWRFILCFPSFPWLCSPSQIRTTSLNFLDESLNSYTHLWHEFGKKSYLPASDRWLGSESIKYS